MSKLSKIVDVMKQPEILATIALGGATVVAGKVLLDNYREKAACAECCCACEDACDEAVTCDAVQPDAEVEG